MEQLVLVYVNMEYGAVDPVRFPRLSVCRVIPFVDSRKDSQMQNPCLNLFPPKNSLLGKPGDDCIVVNAYSRLCVLIPDWKTNNP